MAPELFMESAPSVASDLYSVGVIAYEMFAGALPFDPTNVAQMISDRLGSFSMNTLPIEVAAFIGEVTDIDKDAARRYAIDFDMLPPELRPVIKRLLERAPKDRYASTSDVIRALGLPTETIDTRESYLQAADLVGRNRELGELISSFNGVFAGRGGAWLFQMITSFFPDGKFG